MSGCKRNQHRWRHDRNSLLQCLGVCSDHQPAGPKTSSTVRSQHHVPQLFWRPNFHVECQAHLSTYEACGVAKSCSGPLTRLSPLVLTEQLVVWVQRFSGAMNISVCSTFYDVNLFLCYVWFNGAQVIMRHSATCWKNIALVVSDSEFGCCCRFLSSLSWTVFF